jgi:hypothetical protein
MPQPWLDRAGQFVDSDQSQPVYSWFGHRQARRTRDPISAPHPNWLAPSLVPVHLVCGPPASGKSTFVREHARPGDLILDFDQIVNSLTGLPHTRAWDRDTWLRPAMAVRNARLAALAKPGPDGDPPWPQAWFIVHEPMAAGRVWWRKALGKGVTYVLPTSPALCRARVAADAERRAVAAFQHQGIDNWWKQYTPAQGDTVVGTTKAAA